MPFGIPKSPHDHSDMAIDVRNPLWAGKLSDKLIYDHFSDAIQYQAARAKAEKAARDQEKAVPMDPMQQIAMRMRWGSEPGRIIVTGFEFIQAYVKDNVAVVFIVHGGKPVTIEDDAGLFPSDALITKLRLLLG